MEAQHNPPERGKENRETGDSLAETKNIRQSVLPNATSELENHPRGDSTTSHHARQAEMATQATPQDTSTPSAETPSASQELNLLTASDADFAAWITEFISRVAINAGVLYDQSVMDRLAELGAADMGRWTFLIQQCKLEKKALKGVPIRDWQAKMEKQITTIQKATEAAKQEANQASDLQVLDRDAPLLLQQGWSAMESHLTALIQKYGAQPVLMYPTTIKLCAAAIAAGFKAECQTWQDRLVAAREGWTSRQAKTWMDQFKPSRTKAAQHQWDVLDGTEPAPEPEPANEEPLPATFEGMTIPAKYLVSTSEIATVYQNEAGEWMKKVIAYAPLVILRMLTHADTNRQYVEMGWLKTPHSHSWTKQIVERQVITDSRRLLELAAYGAAIHSENSRQLIGYLADLEHANRLYIPETIATSHLGWQARDIGFVANPTRYLSADGTDRPIEFLGGTDGDTQNAQGFASAGEFGEWLNALKAIQSFPLVQLGLLSSLAVPLLQLIKTPNFVVDYGGTTSTGKTVTLMVAASAWGQPDYRDGASSMFSWRTTGVGIEMISQLLNGLPTILDDTTAAENPQKITNMLYGVVSGIGKIRGSKNGGGRSVGHWRTILLSSGEQPITSFSNKGGAKTRTLAVTQMPFVDKQQGLLVQALTHSLKQHYGHAGPLFVQWLLQHRSEWSHWAQRYQNRLLDLTKTRTSTSNRLMEYRVLLETAAQLIDQAWAPYNAPWTFGPFTESSEWEQLWEQFETQASDPLNLAEALRRVGSWAQSHAEEFMGRRTDTDHPPLHWAGQWRLESQGREVANELCIYTDVLDKLLKDWDYRPESIIGGWRERGWLRGDPDGRHANPRIKIITGPDKGQQKRVFYVFSPQGQAIAFGDAEPDDAEPAFEDEFPPPDDPDDFPF